MPPISRNLMFRGYVSLMTLSGIGVLAAAWASTRGENLLGDYPVEFAVFAVLLFLTELKPMTYHANGGEVTASWTFAFALLFIAPVTGGLLVASAATFTADMLRSKSTSKAAFNASQFALCLGIGVLAGSQIHDLMAVANGETLGLRWLAAAAVASAVSFVLNGVIISVVIALHQAMPPREMLLRSLKVNLGMDGVLLALSPVFLLAGIEAPILVPLLLGTVMLIFRSATVALSNRHEATHDQLTDIPNRRLFEDHIDLMLDNAKRSDEKMALIHVDLDGFKGINDRLGHHYGDEVLKTVAARLEDTKRPVDFAARLGGDEFVMALGSLSSAGEAEGIARSLWNRLRQPMEIGGVPLAVGASLGVALYPEDGEDLHTLLNHADMAMYDAKSGALGVKVHTRDEEGTGPSRLDLVTDLERAIESDELVLFYQPKVDIPSGRITGVEALLRWNHREHGMIDPGWFIPQAEQTELMTPLTDRVMEMAVGQGVEWLNQGVELTVSVNTSARNLHDLKFPGRVADILDRLGMEPKWLELEITENTVMADPVRAAAVITRLREIGVSLAIDDFGTGYSSLASLRTLTIDRLKIDKSFITSLDSDDGDLTIVRSVIDLGKALGLVVVAEGIESTAVYELVRGLGCDEFQGYLMSKPIPAADVRDLLRAEARRTDGFGGSAS